MDNYLPQYFRWLLLTVAFLAFGNCAAYWLYLEYQGETIAALEDLEKCRKLRSQIQNARSGLPTASLSNENSKASLSAIRTGLAAEAIDEKNIESIASRAPIPIRKTVFERVDSTVLLKDVELGNVLHFADRYERDSNVVCSQLELRAFDNTNAQESRWIADLTFSQIVRTLKPKR